MHLNLPVNASSDRNVKSRVLSNHRQTEERKSCLNIFGFITKSVDNSADEVNQSSYNRSNWPNERQNKQREHQNCDMFEVILRSSLVSRELYPLLVIKFLTIKAASVVWVTAFRCNCFKVCLVLFVELTHKFWTEVGSAVLACCAVHKHVVN